MSRSQIVFYVLSILVVLSMIISAFASLFTTPVVNAPATRAPVITATAIP
ncbi:MAG: hypothetical protein ACUVR3_13365 [Candidatus Roseilinea sp.]